MVHRFGVIAAFLMICNIVQGQLPADSLSEVQVQAFAYQKNSLQTPAAIATIRVNGQNVG